MKCSCPEVYAVKTWKPLCLSDEGRSVSAANKVLAERPTTWRCPRCLRSVPQIGIDLGEFDTSGIFEPMDPVVARFVRVRYACAVDCGWRGWFRWRTLADLVRSDREELERLGLIRRTNRYRRAPDGHWEVVFVWFEFA
jgi:hypothetical protein